MRTILFALSLLFVNNNYAQVITFESLPPTADTYYVNYTKPGIDNGFTEASIYFPCVYDTAWGGFWGSGWAWSNVHDSSSQGITNQYAAKTFLGNNNSQAYAVGYGKENFIKVNSATFHPASFYVTNSTYAYESMKHGDFFAKQFGGVTGDDEDWFKLSIRGYYQGVAVGGEIEFYLADYRFADNTKDYIVRDWKQIDLSQLGNLVDSVSFSLSSSDTGAFGMNTPSYFCVDDIMPQVQNVRELKSKITVEIFPNPAQDFIHLLTTNKQLVAFKLVDAMGKVLLQGSLQNKTVINISSLPAANYYIITSTATTCFTKL